MASKYQEQHYKDVAEILLNTNPVMRFDPPFTERGAVMRATIIALVLRFADLFAADSPPVCNHVVVHQDGKCDRPGGFDREWFLKACGLEGA